MANSNGDSGDGGHLATARDLVRTAAGALWRMARPGVPRPDLSRAEVGELAPDADRAAVVAHIRDLAEREARAPVDASAAILGWPAARFRLLRFAAVALGEVDAATCRRAHRPSHGGHPPDGEIPDIAAASVYRQRAEAAEAAHDDQADELSALRMLVGQRAKLAPDTISTLIATAAAPAKARIKTLRAAAESAVRRAEAAEHRTRKAEERADEARANLVDVRRELDALKASQATDRQAAIGELDRLITSAREAQ